MWKVVIICIYLIALSIMDIRERQVPLYLLLAGLILSMVMGIGTEISKGGIGGKSGLLQIGWKMLLGLLPGIFFSGIAWVTASAGKADGLVLMVLGFLTDYRICMAIFCASLLFISLFSIGMLLLHKIHKKTRLPYIPFLAAAYIGYQICKGV